MAKKKREEDWQPPEFNEVDFMKKEIRGARASIMSVLWAVPAAFASYAFTLVDSGAGPAIGFFTGLGMMYLLKWILPILRVDVSAFKRRDWLGHGSSFFFSWLAFWILLLNPPFADLTAPVINGITVNGTSVTCGGNVASTTSSVDLNVTASDNVGVTFASYAVGGQQANPLSRTSGNLWQASFAIPTSASVTITLSDAAGHSASCQFTITRSG